MPIVRLEQESRASDENIRILASASTYYEQ